MVISIHSHIWCTMVTPPTASTSPLASIPLLLRSPQSKMSGSSVARKPVIRIPITHLRTSTTHNLCLPSTLIISQWPSVMVLGKLTVACEKVSAPLSYRFYLVSFVVVYLPRFTVSRSAKVIATLNPLYLLYMYSCVTLLCGVFPLLLLAFNKSRITSCRIHTTLRLM